MNIFKSLFIDDKGKPLYGHAPIPPYPVGHNMIHCYRKDVNKMNIKELTKHLEKNRIHMKHEQVVAIEKILETAEEFDSLMQAGLDELAVGGMEICEEYFSDAAFVIKDLSDDLKEELCNKYEVNPLDFAC